MSMSMRGWVAVVVGALAAVVTVDTPNVGQERAVAVGVREARADDFGFSVLKCFHPTGTYTGSTLGDEYKDADGRMTRKGHIDFKGGFTGSSYAMDFVLHSKTEGGDKFLRVTPGADSAPMPPASGCYMRNWWRTN